MSRAPPVVARGTKRPSPRVAGRNTRSDADPLKSGDASHVGTSNVAELEPELKQIVDKLDELTLLQASKLVKHLEEHWGVSAAAPVAVAAAPAAGGGAAAAEEKTTFDVILEARRREEDPGHQGSPRDHGPGPQGGQGPGRRRPEGGEGRGHEGRGREDQGAARGRRRQGQAGISRRLCSSRTASSDPAGGVQRLPRGPPWLLPARRARPRLPAPIGGAASRTAAPRRRSETDHGLREARAGPDQGPPRQPVRHDDRQEPTPSRPSRATPRSSPSPTWSRSRPSPTRIPAGRRAAERAATTQGLEALLREVFPIQSYDKTMWLEYLGYELGKPALHARRVPQAAADLRLPVQGPPAPDQARADRGGGLPRRDPDHDRRRRVHHQRLRARDRQPAPPLARRRLLGRHRTPATRSCTRCWIIPERGSWIELNVTKKDVLAVRIDQSGKFPATTLLRALDEEFAHATQRHPARLLHDARSSRSARRRRRAPSPSRSPASIAVGDIVVLKTGEVLVASGAADLRGGRARDRRQRSGRGRGHRRRRRGPRHADPQHAARGHDARATRRRCSRSTAACARATRRSSRRRRSSSTRSSSTRSATAWAASAASASTASSTRRSPRTTRSCSTEDIVNSIKYLIGAARRQGRDRRHRPPRQPPRAHDRRARRRRVPQGLPQAAPHGAGAHEPREPGDGHAAQR